jgi:hypothetical protein
VDKQGGEESPEEDPVPHLWKEKESVNQSAETHLKNSVNTQCAPMV